MDQNTVFWIAGAVAVFVFVDVLIVEIRRSLREARRIVARLAGYADLPIVSFAASLPNEVLRLTEAFAAIAALLVRGRAALVALGFVRDPEPR